MRHDRHDDENFERRQNLQHDEEAFQLRQEEKRLGTARRSNTFNWIEKSIFWFLLMVEMLLAMRFVLRLLGANRENVFFQLINNVSTPLIAPFSTLFISPTSGNGNYIFDVNIVIATIAYVLLSYLAVSLVQFVSSHK